jgi:hypothetical protein
MTPHDQISTPLGFAEFAAEWFGVFVPQALSSRIAKQARQHTRRWETAAGPVCWVKNRLLDEGYFKPGGQCHDDSFVTAILHVGFLSLPESPEMIARLKNELAEEPSPARSRFANSVQRYAVSPIDATAGRVSPGDAK